MPEPIRHFATARAVARAAPRRLRPLARHLAPLGFGLACLWLLAHRLDGLDASALAAAFARIPPAGWAGAVLATALSFWAVGRYDVIVHRMLRTGLDERAAARAGRLSIALAQTLGLGVITGALARWRALPHSTLADCTRISLLVALSFLAGLAVITAGASLALPAPPAARALAAPVLLAALGFIAVAFLVPRLTLSRLPVPRALSRLPLSSPVPGGRVLHLPSLPAIGAILWFTLVDTFAAALALHLLIPAEVAPGMATLYPVFLLALGAALLSGTPGGVGPFELALFAALPELPEPGLMAGVLGFRAVYYALPAALAALRLAAPRPHSAPPRRRADPRPGPRLLAHARRAELGVARQNGGRILRACGAGGAAAGVTVRTGQTLTMLFDPAEGEVATLLPALRAAARAEARVPLLYKCAARSAAHARMAGWSVLHMADEAVLDPRSFDLAQPARRQLRRKLRQADRAGITCKRAATLPLAAMARIDAQWCARQGGARGFSMGRFDPEYLTHHQVFLAWQGDRLAGFVSFHASAHELCLDLMRSADDAPQGTMHALVAQAIFTAARNGRRRLSLAALPARSARADALPASFPASFLARLLDRPARRLQAAVFAAAGGPGLTQFKAAFAPRLEPLYMAAPSRAGLLLAAADLARVIRNPQPPHDDHQEFMIAPTRGL